jgi:hypothetical protein
MAMVNTLAYYDMASITAVKGFYSTGPGVKQTGAGNFLRTTFQRVTFFEGV